MSVKSSTVHIDPESDPSTAKVSDKASFELSTSSAPTPDYNKKKDSGMNATQVLLFVLLGCVLLSLVIIPWVLYANEAGKNNDNDGDGGDNDGAAMNDDDELTSIFPEGTDFGDVHIFVVGDWGRVDWAEEENEPDAAKNQTQVADAMNKIAGTRTGHKVIVSTGDNFYDDGLANLDDAETFMNNFVNVYQSRPNLKDLPWYVLMGNHDYRGSILAQLDFNVNKWVPNNLWKAQLGGKNTILKSFNGKTSVDLAWIDTSPFILKYRNCPGTKTYDFQSVGYPFYVPGSPTSSAFDIALQQKVDELDAALTQNDYVTTWRLALGHHAIRSNSHHKDTVELLNQVDEVLWKHGVHAYVNGHDHDLQHVTRTYCCVFDQGTPAYGTEEDSDPACNQIEVPPIAFSTVDSAPYTSNSVPMNGRPMHYFTSGAGSMPRVDDTYPELDDSAINAKYWSPEPGFLEIQAKEQELNFFFYDKYGNKQYDFQIKK